MAKKIRIGGAIKEKISRRSTALSVSLTFLNTVSKKHPSENGIHDLQVNALYILNPDCQHEGLTADKDGRRRIKTKSHPAGGTAFDHKNPE